MNYIAQIKVWIGKILEFINGLSVEISYKSKAQVERRHSIAIHNSFFLLIIAILLIAGWIIKQHISNKI
jgi:hypothetical protein